MEDTIEILPRPMPMGERATFLNRLLDGGISDAAGAGKSLTLIRPKNTEFRYSAKSTAQIDKERETFRKAASQGDFFDDELVALEPCPYEFRFHFEDADGQHNFRNGDWEAHAMFFNGRNRLGSDKATLQWMSETFNEHYPLRGMLFCLGNMARRPRTWMLLGVLRVDDTQQGLLPF